MSSLQMQKLYGMHTVKSACTHLPAVCTLQCSCQIFVMSAAQQEMTYASMPAECLRFLEVLTAW